MGISGAHFIVFLEDEQHLNGDNGVPDPLMIMIDESVVLLLAVPLSFTAESVLQYFRPMLQSDRGQGMCRRPKQICSSPMCESLY